MKPCAQVSRASRAPANGSKKLNQYLAGEAIANPRFCEDVLGSAGIRLDLFSKIGDEDAQVITLISVVWSPHGLEQFSMRNRLAGIGDKISKKIELFWSQANRSLARANPA